MSVDGDEPDLRAFEQLTLDLGAALAEADVTRLDRVAAGTAPEGARGIEILGVVTFMITAVQTVEALEKVVRAIRACLARYAQRHRPARVNLAGMDVELTGDSDVRPVVAALFAQPGRTASGVRRALIVANARYDDRALARLRAPAHDADALARVLGAPSIGDNPDHPRSRAASGDPGCPSGCPTSGRPSCPTSGTSQLSKVDPRPALIMSLGPRNSVDHDP